MKYSFIFILSGISLLIERLWNSFWASFSIILIFLSLSLLALPQALPPLLHLALLLIFVTTLIISIKLNIKNFREISISDIKRKIEARNNLNHLPLDIIVDKPLFLSELWAEHVKIAKDKIKSISKIYKPEFQVAKKDIYALRHIATIIFIITLIIIPKNNWQVHIASAIRPNLKITLNHNIEKNIDIWVEAPAYTNRPAFILNKNYSNKSIDIIKGSTIKAIAKNYKLYPRLKYNGNIYKISSTKNDDEITSIEANNSGELKLTQFFLTINKWHINIIEDQAPQVEVIAAEGTALYSTRIKYKIKDDFGIEKAEALFTLTKNKDDADIYKFQLGVQNIDYIEQSHSEDLTAHIWAGKKVSLFIRATDNNGNITESDKIEFTLPERKFSNSFAAQIANYRKALIEHDNQELRNRIASSLAEIAIRPNIYKNNISTFMALSVAIRRIINSKDNNGILNLLWDIALQLEDGGLKTSQQKLYQALQNLQNSAANNNLSNQEKQQLVDEVQKAILEYVQALSNEVRSRLQQGKTFPSIPSKVAEKLENSIDIQEILERLQNMSDTNSYQDMMDFAQKLKNSLENFDINSFEKMQQKQTQALESINKLEDIIKEQQMLLSATNLTQDVEKIKSLTPVQQEIQNSLSEAIKELNTAIGNLPDNFANAHKAMNLSQENLKQGFAISSAMHQEKAIQELQQGIDEASSKVAEAIQDSLLSLSFMPRGANFGENYDPLGRQIGTDNIKLPNHSDMQESKKILEELRKRINQPNRNPLEREYIERLIH